MANDLFRYSVDLAFRKSSSPAWDDLRGDFVDVFVAYFSRGQRTSRRDEAGLCCLAYGSIELSSDAADELFVCVVELLAEDIAYVSMTAHVPEPPQLYTAAGWYQPETRDAPPN